MEDSELYDKLYTKVRYIIKKRKIDVYCANCARSGNGCCSNCYHLGKNGCKVKSLICSLWFCNKNKSFELLTLLDLITLSNIEKIARDRGWLSFRASKKETLEFFRGFNAGYDYFKFALPISLLYRRLKKG